MGLSPIFSAYLTRCSIPQMAWRWKPLHRMECGQRVRKPKRHDSMWPRTSDCLVHRKEAETAEFGACFSFAASKTELPREEGPGKCVPCLRGEWWHHVTAGSQAWPWGWHLACTRFRATGSKDLSTHTYQIITVYTLCSVPQSCPALFQPHGR